jgi:hypothetical protein
MRSNALCLIASLAVLAILPSAAAVPAQSDRQPAVSAPRDTPAAQACPRGYYWEPEGYVRHGKFRPAHCARR